MTFLEWLNVENNQLFVLAIVIFVGIFTVLAIALWRASR